MGTNERAWPDIAIPPGETLAEILEGLGISQAELARRAGRPAQAISEMVQGKKEITPETALEFERVLGVPAHVWVRMEADYRTVKARLVDAERLKAELPLAKLYPYAAMAKLKWIARSPDAVDKVRQLLRFFGVASLQNVPKPDAAWRRSTVTTVSTHALQAWIRRGEILAQATPTREFNAAGLEEMIPVLRTLTFDAPGTNSLTRVRTILAENGVALVFVPHLPGTGAHGATRWLGAKATMQLSIRYGWADILWFSLFHELVHILKHDRRVFIEFKARVDSPLEHEANLLAARWLIPETSYQRFVSGTVLFSAAAVTDFAASINIHPGIVVGRLKHDKKIPQSHLNHLRLKYAWEGDAKDDKQS